MALKLIITGERKYTEPKRKAKLSDVESKSRSKISATVVDKSAEIIKDIFGKISDTLRV